MTRSKARLEHSVTIDTRSLALFRIIAGLLIAFDAILRSRNFSYFYTNEGVVTDTVRESVLGDTFLSQISIFTHAGDTTLIAILFVCYFLIGVLLVLGYRTRTVTALAFIFVVSLDYHNTLILSYADILFQVLLFWAIFLPLNERWSIDAVHTDTEPRTTISSITTAIILLQMVTMYYINWTHKVTSEVWWTGEAAPITLGMDHFTFLLGDSLRAYPELLQIGGIIWFLLLGISPLLIILVEKQRFLFTSMFASGHLAFALTVRIGAFPYVAMNGLVLFIQTSIWETINTHVEKHGFKERIESTKQHANTVAYCFPHFTIVRDSNGGQKLVQFGRKVYNHPPQFFILFCILAMFIAIQPPWAIFAPEPPGEDRYYVVSAETESGEHIDLYNERELTYDRPQDELQKQFNTYRERFYMTGLHREVGDDDIVAQTYGDYLCEAYAEEHDEELVRLNVWLISEDITMDTFDTVDDRERSSELLYQHGCGDNEPEEIDPPDF